MMFKSLTVILSLLCLALFIGCSGEDGAVGPAGPAGTTGATGADGTDGADGADGPNLLLAYGDIDYVPLPGSSHAISRGPEDLTVSVVDNGAGDFTVTLNGIFSNITGTLLVSTSSNDYVGSVVTTGTITSWNTYQIVFGVKQYDISTGALNSDDFSFVILGRTI